MKFLILCLQALYVFVPAYAANMAPVVAGKMGLPGGTPISVTLFGAHKTWRGVWSAYIGAGLGLLLQYGLQFHGVLEWARIIDYFGYSLALLAIPFGLGAIGGDVLKSYVKRRLGFAPGTAWFPFDQLDFVAGALALLLPFVALPWTHVVAIVILTPGLHFLVNAAGYWLGFKDVWW